MCEKATILDSRPAMGKTQKLVECSCGAQKWVYVWSWAGHGKFMCPGCGRKIRYWDKAVIG